MKRKDYLEVIEQIIIMPEDVLNNNIKNTKIRNIVDMAVRYSSMPRTFSEGSKSKIIDEVVKHVATLKKVDSRKQFDNIHSKICSSLVYIRSSKSDKGSISYGQIAKTINVVFKVLVYYNCIPELINIERYLHAAVDNDMMKMLKSQDPKGVFSNRRDKWPINIKEIEKDDYEDLLEQVDNFIKKQHNNKITPIQFDDFYWRRIIDNKNEIK